MRGGSEDFLITHAGLTEPLWRDALGAVRAIAAGRADSLPGCSSG